MLGGLDAVVGMGDPANLFPALSQHVLNISGRKESAVKASNPTCLTDVRLDSLRKDVGQSLYVLSTFSLGGAPTSDSSCFLKSLRLQKLANDAFHFP